VTIGLKTSRYIIYCMVKTLIIERECTVLSTKNGVGYTTGLIKLNDVRLLAVKGKKAKVRATIKLNKEVKN
jgi:hypothetical protein